MRSKLEFIRGFTQLTGDGFVGTVNMVEGFHKAVIGTAARYIPVVNTVGIIVGRVYDLVRGVGGRVMKAITRLMAHSELLTENKKLDRISESAILAWLSALNGVIGDHLEKTDNNLSLDMVLSRHGTELPLAAKRMSAMMPDARGWLVIFVHGLGMNDLQWHRQKETSFGERLEAHFDCTVLCLHYNSGRHISTNGRAFAAMIQDLVDAYPVPVARVTIIGHSMGGLLCRSACYYAKQKGLRWISLLSEVVCLGSPHLGTPLEQLGNWILFLLAVSPYTKSLSSLGRSRSAGVKDLRYGFLRDEDWHNRDLDTMTERKLALVPLLSHVSYFMAAATLGGNDGPNQNHLLGDGLVSVSSALGRHIDPKRSLMVPPGNCRVFSHMNHMAMIHESSVYEQIEKWLQSGSILIANKLAFANARSNTHIALPKKSTNKSFFTTTDQLPALVASQAAHCAVITQS